MNSTPLVKVYEVFLSKITDDMFMEFSAEETEEMCDELLASALPKFEFPRQDIFNYVGGVDGRFLVELTKEEMNIIATYMVVEWIGQQLASIEHTRMKYSGPDFEFTSQANHLDKLIKLKEHYTKEGFHLQRLYKRRKVGEDGKVKPTMLYMMGREDD